MRLYMEVYFQILNICSFDCATVTGSWKVKPLNLRLTISVGWVLSLQLTVLSRSYPLGYRTFLVVLFCVTFTIHCLSFRGVCHMTASDRFLFSTNAVRSYKASFCILAALYFVCTNMTFVGRNEVCQTELNSVLTPPPKKKKKKKIVDRNYFRRQVWIFSDNFFFSCLQKFLLSNRNELCVDKKPFYFDRKDFVYINEFCKTKLNSVLTKTLLFIRNCFFQWPVRLWFNRIFVRTSINSMNCDRLNFEDIYVL